jgi:transcriptional regulator with XRE-family HTH domain
MPKKADQPTGFAGRLKTLRETAGWTQARLAGRAGLYPFSVAKLEQGVQEPTWPTVLALAKALDVTPNDFDPGDGCIMYADEIDVD